MRSWSLVAILALAYLVLGCGSGSSSAGGSSLAVTPANESSLTTATAGEAYVQTFTFNGGNPPFTVTAPFGAPDSLTFTAGAGTSTATLSGTPSTALTGAFELEVVDAKNVTTILTYAFRVVNAAPGISLSPTTLPAAVQQVLYNQTLTLTGGTAPFTWSVINGTLPPGFSFSSTTTTSNVNALTGKATAPGAFPFTIVVMDTSSPVQTGIFPTSITVN